MNIAARFQRAVAAFELLVGMMEIPCAAAGFGERSRVLHLPRHSALAPAASVSESEAQMQAACNGIPAPWFAGLHIVQLARCTVQS